MKRIFAVVVLVLLMSFSSRSQTTTRIDDPYLGGLSYRKVIPHGTGTLLVGVVCDTISPMVAVIKIDSIGNRVWSTTTHDTLSINFISPYGATKDYPRIILNGDSILYAFFYGETYASPSISSMVQVFKVNLLNGELVWKINYQHTIPYIHDIVDIIDQDSNNILILSHEDHDNIICFTQIAKSDGQIYDTLSFLDSIPYSVDILGFEMDSVGDFYILYRDELVKISGQYPHSIDWIQSFPSLGVKELKDLYTAPSGDLILSVELNHNNKDGFITVSKYDGSIIASRYPGSPLYGFLTLIDIKFIGDYAYALYWDESTSYNSDLMILLKFNYKTGTKAWEIHERPVFGSFTNPGPYPTIPYALSINTLGDIYVTGASTIDPLGDIGFLSKIDQLNGNIIWTRGLKWLSGSHYNNGSGLYSYEKDNKVYTFSRYNPLKIFYHGSFLNYNTLSILSSDSGQILFQKDFGGLYNYKTKVVAVEKYKNNKTLQLNKLGRFTNVVCYDDNFDTIWSTTLSSLRYMIPVKMLIKNDENILIGCEYWPKYPPGINDELDSLLFYTIDSTGKVFDTIKFHNWGGNYVDDNANFLHDIIQNKFGKTYAFYEAEDLAGNRYCFADLDYAFNDKYGATILLNRNCGKGKSHLFEHPTGKILLLAKGSYSGPIRVYELIDSNISLGVVTTLSDTWLVYDVFKTNNDDLIIGGQSKTDKIEQMISYNIALNQINWKREYDTLMEVRKVILDPAGFIYSASFGIGLPKIRKINEATGNLIWTYTDSLILGDTVEIVDLAYSSTKNELSAVGFVDTEVNGKHYEHAYLLRLNSNGTLKSSLLFPTTNRNSKLELAVYLKDEKLMCGGYVEHGDPLKNFGLLYFPDSIDVAVEFPKGGSKNNDLSFNLFPNPIYSTLNLNIDVETDDKTIVLGIYDIQGKKLISDQINCPYPGTYNYRTNVQALKPGIYILRIQSGELLSMKRFIKI